MQETRVSLTPWAERRWRCILHATTCVCYIRLYTNKTLNTEHSISWSDLNHLTHDNIVTALYRPTNRWAVGELCHQRKETPLLPPRPLIKDSLFLIKLKPYPPSFERVFRTLVTRIARRMPGRHTSDARSQYPVSVRVPGFNRHDHYLHHHVSPGTEWQPHQFPTSAVLKEVTIRRTATSPARVESLTWLGSFLSLHWLD